MLNAPQIITASLNISANISALPAGIIRHPEPLSNHHYILTSDNIAPAGELIFNILQDRITNKDPDTPFVAALLEEHGTIADILIKADVLSRFALHQQDEPSNLLRNFMYAHEQPHNLLYLYTRRFYEKNIQKQYKYNTSLCDPDNHLLMNAIIADNQFPHVPQANNILYKTLLKYNITTCFNDAATTNNQDFLDYNDKITAKNIRKEHETIADLIKANDKDGMYVRNIVMPEIVLTKHDKSYTILQGAGVGHGGVKNDKESPYELSLLKAYRDKGANVTSVFLSKTNYKAQNIIPDQALKDDPDMIIIDGMPEYKGSYRDPDDESSKILLLQRAHNQPHLITPDYQGMTSGDVYEELCEL